MRHFIALFSFLFLLLLIPSQAAQAGDSTIVGTATATAPSATWIAASAPLSGDDNHNGHSLFELASSASGPFSSDAALWSVIPGPSEWRAAIMARDLVLPGTAYFVRVTWLDPDGVIGPNPQIIGPITTPASSPAAVSVGTASASVRDTEIFVTMPVSDDANRNSGGTVEIATSASGPWTRKCGSSSDANLPFHPKHCRVRGLIPGQDYWARVTITDPDGVVGTNPQTLGPITYTGFENLALGQPITADPGWGCCPSPAELVDGRIQNDAWFYGFAWTGGTGNWGGGSPGIKQATIDLGAPTTFNRGVVWYHESGVVPSIWSFAASDDGVTWTDVVSTSEPICRGESTELPGHWELPACGHDATFPATTARYFRFSFDDTTLFRDLHGWAVEIEVFNTLEDGDFVVTHTGDSGPGSLRQAIVDANAASGAQLISFAIPASDPGFDGSVFTIRPLSELPVMSDITLDGATQAALTGDTNPWGPEVVIDGSLQGGGSGLRLDDNNVVRGLVINGFASGLGVGTSWSFASGGRGDNNQIVDNYIGTDPTGATAAPNNLGVLLQGYASPGVQASGNLVEGNLIAGNLNDGINLCDAADNDLFDNRIGTDRDGLSPLGNGRRGIAFYCAGAPRNQVIGNTIAWSAEDGVYDSPDYRFGVAYSPDGHRSNRIQANAIFANGGLGINLLPPPYPPTEPPGTPTPNDSCDSDGGGNLLQNFPELTLVTSDGAETTVEGMLDGMAEQSFAIELFANQQGDATGFGEGRTLLASSWVTTDALCTASFSLTLPLGLPEGSVVTATATDVDGNTSELSAGLGVGCYVSGDSDGDGVCDAVDLCAGDDATGDLDLDGFCADSDCDDADPDAVQFDVCGVCGGTAFFCDGFESGGTSGWSIVKGS